LNSGRPTTTFAGEPDFEKFRYLFSKNWEIEIGFEAFLEEKTSDADLSVPASAPLAPAYQISTKSPTDTRKRSPVLWLRKFHQTTNSLSSLAASKARSKVSLATPGRDYFALPLEGTRRSCPTGISYDHPFQSPCL
jgi:hypothetical protein